MFMLDKNEALAMILSGTEQIMKDNGFSVIRPQDTEKGAVPATVDGDHTYIDFSGEKGKIRIEVFGTQLLLFFTDVNAEEATEEDFKKASANYFAPEIFDERDIKSLCNEIIDSIGSKFGERKAAGGKSKKMPVPISKSAAKNGTQSYDGNTLANRLTAIYPELKEEYRANFEKYNEFLPEEFFTVYANSLIIGTIKYNQKQDMTKLFKILNDIYENGTNDTQSLVAVTILGELNNDQQLIENASKYMCDDLKDTVILINKYLATAKGKRMREKMKNPPPYKPKKEKKPGLMAQMMGGANTGGMPPM